MAPDSPEEMARSNRDRSLAVPPCSPVAAVCFILIFPGFFVYHSAVGTGYIPPVLGGYWTSIAAMTFPFLAGAYLKDALQFGPRIAPTDAAFFLFVAYFVAVVGFSFAMGANPEIALPDLSVALQFLVIFGAVKLFDPGDRTFRRVLLVTYVILTATIFLNVSVQDLVVATYALSAADESRADYQGFAFTYTVVTVFCVALSRSRWLRALIYGTALSALYLNGARAEFLVLPVAAFVTEFCYARRRAQLVLGVTGVAVVLLLTVEALVAALPETRISALLEYASDESVVERSRMGQEAWQTVSEHPISGRYASYPVGEYAHTVLSAWVDLGLPGLLLFMSLLLVPLTCLVRDFGARSREPVFILTLAVLLMAIALFSSAKGYKYQLFPAAVALFARYRRTLHTPMRT